MWYKYNICIREYDKILHFHVNVIIVFYQGSNITINISNMFY